MILVIGEILMDMIGYSDASSLRVNGKLGGAPLNVASDLADLGIEVTFHGILGNDIIGDLLKKQLKDQAGNIHFALKTKNDRQTTIAVFLKDKGEFQFLRKLGADYCFEEDTLMNLPYKEAHIIHFGSLFLSEKQGRNNIFAAIERYKKENKIISFDVNFRSDIFSNDQNYISYYKQMVSYADIVKFTKDELLMIYGAETIEEALEDLKDKKIVFITDGSNGSYCFYKNKVTYKPSVKVTPIDTIGCGDSFMAGALSYLENHNIDSLSEEDILSLLQRGNECGKRTCLVEGALHAYKNLEELEAIK